MFIRFPQLPQLENPSDSVSLVCLSLSFPSSHLFSICHSHTVYLSHAFSVSLPLCHLFLTLVPSLPLPFICFNPSSNLGEGGGDFPFHILSQKSIFVCALLLYSDRNVLFKKKKKGEKRREKKTKQGSDEFKPTGAETHTQGHRHTHT